MITTSNLGLVVWDDETDLYEHSQLADNFVRIDEHSHLGGLSEALNSHGELTGGGHWTALGNGLAIKTGAIEPEAILRYLIKQRAVGHGQLDVEAVEAENIQKESIENKHLANSSVNDRTVENETLTINKFDPNILSLGTTILWYKYAPSAEPGDIWHVCDGTPWASIPNALGLSTGNIPDLREKFIRGTDVNHTGETGGSPSINLGHTHTTTAAALNHTHTVGAHNHVIQSAGLHHHTFEGGYQLGSRKNAFVNNLTLEGHANALQSVYLETFNEGQEAANASMDQSGEHNHGGVTGLSAASTTSESSLAGSVATNEALQNVSTTPPFVGFCVLMRVR